MEIIKVIAVILAVFLHRGNSRAITSTGSDNIERMLGLVREELNTALNDTNQKPTEREESPADLLRLVESDLPSQEPLQAFSDVVSGESAIPPTEATIIWRHKRSDDSEPDCLDKLQTLTVLNSTDHLTVTSYPICKPHPASNSPACSNSINTHGQRKCVASNFRVVRTSKTTTRAIPTICSCA